MVWFNVSRCDLDAFDCAEGKAFEVPRGQQKKISRFWAREPAEEKEDGLLYDYHIQAIRKQANSV